MTSFPHHILDLSGNRWYISAGETTAAPVVAALAEVMSLSPARSLPRNDSEHTWREVRVLIDCGQGTSPVGCSETGPVFSLVPPPNTTDRLAFGMSLVALSIAQAELTRGGLLIHGALAAPPDHARSGVILAGPAEVGKTTASRRLPTPWRSLSDDATMVVRNSSGQYMAHPWPTWSRFFRPGAGRDQNQMRHESWNTGEGLELRALYFLRQAEENMIKPLAAAQAVTYLMETVQLVSSLMRRDLAEERVQAFYAEQLSAVEQLLLNVPSSMLHLSLTGSFWQTIETSLAMNGQGDHQRRRSTPETTKKKIPCRNNSVLRQRVQGDTMTVCYYGTSMNPTLTVPDILEVLPYAGKPVRKGDIIYFRSPFDGRNVIHRVVRVVPEGICTRGDNSAEDDPSIVSPKNVIGRVAAAWRYGRYRNIAGGTLGVWSGYGAAVFNRVNRWLSPLLRTAYRGLSSLGIARLILPSSWQPRVITFKERNRPPLLKLIVKGKIIGHYDEWSSCWIIKRPWRLMVDMSGLPPAGKLTPSDPSATPAAAERKNVRLSPLP